MLRGISLYITEDKMKRVKKLLPIILIIGITVFASLFLYTKIIDHEKQQCFSRLGEYVGTFNQEISVKFGDETGKLHMVETMLQSDDNLSEDRVGYLHLEQFQPTTIFSRIDILYPDGVVVSNGTERLYRGDVDFDTIAARGDHMSHRITDAETGRECIYYCIPVARDGETAAILIGVIDAEQLSEVFVPSIYNGSASYCVVDSYDGNYVIDSWHSELGNAYSTEARKRMPGYEDINLKEETKSLSTGVIAFESRTNGKPIYMYYTSVGVYDWQMMLFVQDDVIFSNLNYLKSLLFATGAAEVVLLLLCFLLNLRTVYSLERSNAEIASQREELKSMSYHDLLTSMFNRNKYIEVIERLDSCEVSSIGVAYIDMNGLKQINDSLSHTEGDRYIKAAADVIKGMFPECCYRIGGDEFVVISRQTEENVFRDKLRLVRERMTDNGVSISMGAEWTEKCTDIEALLRDAERAMYVEKERYYSESGERR